MKLKLHRDKIVSILNGKELVGLYVKYPHCIANTAPKIRYTEYLPEVYLGDMSPAKADKIIRLWNTK